MIDPYLSINGTGKLPFTPQARQAVIDDIARRDASMKKAEAQRAADNKPK